MQFDVGLGQSDIIKLENFSFVGNQLVVEGDISLDSKTKKLTNFSFPKISHNLFNTMSLSGKRNSDGIVKLRAIVQTLDGRHFLRNRFLNNTSVGPTAGKPKASIDYDLEADIYTIIGGKGSFISGTKINLKRRNGKISWFDMHGRLNRQSAIAVRLEQVSRNKRILKAESDDAGSTFRMIGLYPHITGGKLSLKVDMDPRGTTEKKGTLWVKDFYVVSTQSVDSQMKSADVFSDDMIGASPTPTRRRRGKNRVIKTKMQFNQLKAPFSYGDGQFILHDSYVNGPVIGATLRGKIDFRTERMHLGGTYVPLYGLNSAIGEIPVLSHLLVGRQGEGVFGVTFAVEGPTAKPTVIVNPVSLLTPGVFRQIFDFNTTTKNQQIQKQPRNRKRRKQRSRNRTGAY